jgi:putative DNA methylase
VIAQRRLIESDDFPFEFISRLAERESWRKEIHRPIYHVHKWWAKRLGSVFRSILLACVLEQDADFESEFYRCHSLDEFAVLDPFMGSGTTIGEAHKLGMMALGRDINPVAVQAVRSALGPLNRRDLRAALEQLSETVGPKIRSLYRATGPTGRQCDVLYYFWVMQSTCPTCQSPVDLFSSHIVARNASPNRRRQVRIRCPECGGIFEGLTGQPRVQCAHCSHTFNPTDAPAKGSHATCPNCASRFKILEAIGQNRPRYRLYAKLVLTGDNRKVYVKTSAKDDLAYQESSRLLNEEIIGRRIRIPDLMLEPGYNTRQAINYNFKTWADFFNDRQLLALGWLRHAIDEISDEAVRNSMMTLFSGVLEFNNLFASYKGEGTGAVRHMFSHHILKPERTPIEANVWGTPKSSGSFTSLFRGRLLRAIEYREAPVELRTGRSRSTVCSAPFTGNVNATWPTNGEKSSRGLYLSTGDSVETHLPTGSIDLVVTDPPFFDNVHYSELADFFYAWQQLSDRDSHTVPQSTRCLSEVQDTDATAFTSKLRAVFSECNRVLKDDGLLVFTYHHSRNEGWRSIAQAILGAGFRVVNTHPVRGEMSVAAPKAQAKHPIQLDIVIVCRKAAALPDGSHMQMNRAIELGWTKLERLARRGLKLSRNDRRVILYGQALASVRKVVDLAKAETLIEKHLDRDVLNIMPPEKADSQALLFEG